MLLIIKEGSSACARPRSMDVKEEEGKNAWLIRTYFNVFKTKKDLLGTRFGRPGHWAVATTKTAYLLSYKILRDEKKRAVHSAHNR